MSELKAIESSTAVIGNVNLVYLKSEADKVIAHHKYKRCLAMAQVLEHVCPMTNRKAKWRDKWYKRWLKIAEQFNEAK